MLTPALVTRDNVIADRVIVPGRYSARDAEDHASRERHKRELLIEPS